MRGAICSDRERGGTATSVVSADAHAKEPSDERAGLERRSRTSEALKQRGDTVVLPVKAAFVAQQLEASFAICTEKTLTEPLDVSTDHPICRPSPPRVSK